MTSQATKPFVLTIAGFDPSGGAGIIADIRTIQRFGCIPVAAITSITFQNSEKYFGAIHQTAESLRAQVEAIVGQHKISAIKIGMLPTAEVIREVARLTREKNLPAPVIDPVMESTTGGKLMADDAFEVFVTELLPLARLVTPNIPEAEKLAGVNIIDEEAIRQAATRIRELGVRAVLVKGGHLKQGLGVRGHGSGRYRTPMHRGCERVKGTTYGDSDSEAKAADILDDGGKVTAFRSEWIDAPNVRGTGCKLSSGITACLAQNLSLEQSVQLAKRFVAEAIRYTAAFGPDPVTLELTEIEQEK